MAVGLFVAITFVRSWRKAKADTDALIDSVLKNSTVNLGYTPDAPSVAFLARHPFLSSRIWKMLGEGGGSLSGCLPEFQSDCDSLLGHVRSPGFRRDYPCACALMQYTVYLCDNTLTRTARCKHPKDELLAASKGAEQTAPGDAKPRA